MDHPLGFGERRVEGAQIGAARRVDQCGAGAGASQLDEVGAVGVAVAGGPLRVDRDRSGAAGERLDGRLEGARRLDHRRQPVARSQQRDGLGCWGPVHCCGVRHRPFTLRPRNGDDAGRQWRQTGRGAQQEAPGLGVPARSRVIDGGPGRPDLDLGPGRLGRHATEALRGDAGDSAARRGERGVLCLERLGEPGPADRREQRIGDHLGFYLSADVSHTTKRTLPGLVAVGVVQEHQPAGRELEVVDDDIGTDSRGERGNPLRRGHLLPNDLRTQPRSA